jgi:DNA-binding winged helix-turn-helix (wHTH) protein
MTDTKRDDVFFDDPGPGGPKYRWSRNPSSGDITLLKNGTVLRGLDQPGLRILGCLARAGPVTVHKYELFEAGWPGERERIPDNAFAQRCSERVDQQIKKLRHRDALDDAKSPRRIIDTVYGEGYRFLPSVHSTAIDPRKAFQEFFGTRQNDPRPGVIILQTDQIDELLPPASLKPSIRLQKARSWINRWDTEGAEAVRSEFLKLGQPLPALVFSDHHTPEDRVDGAPFQISMGLGYTDRTIRIFADDDVCGPWVRLSTSPTLGDALAFHEAVRPDVLTESEHEKDDKPDFFRLLPKNWHPGDWSAMLKNPARYEVRDYGMILRHTDPDKEDQVAFVLAGFTERGTAVAGQYLAAHWLELHGRFFPKTGDDATGRGDFLLIIEGKSWPDVRQWKDHPRFPPITPKRLFELGKKNRRIASCEWAKRFAAKRR